MNKENFRVAVIFIFFAGLCSFPLFFNLGKLSTKMWDESRNGINAVEMLYNHNFIVTNFDGKPDMWNTKPPFFIWMAALSMKFFGISSFSLRLPSALAALSLAIYGFWFSKKHLSDLLPGFFGGLVLVTSVGFIDFHVSRNGDFDAMLSMWIFLYCTQFFIYLETRNRKNLLLASLFLGFAILTKGVAGCLFLPGLFIFIITNKKHLTVFKRPEFYLFALGGLMIGLSYYFLREIYNPGYLKAVLENEITGRYLQTNEGHNGDVWFYLRLLNKYHYSYWLYWIPLAFLVILFTSEGRVKNLGMFLLFQIICYSIILSISQTKLEWYNAPLYAFFALLIGLILTQIYNGLKKYFSSQSQWAHAAIFILFCSAIYASPVQSIFRSSIFQEKESNYNALFFGDFMKNYFALFDQQKSLKIVSSGYNPHLLFYTKAYQGNGYSIDIIEPNIEIHKKDTLLLCDINKWPSFSSAYMFDTIYQEGTDKFVLTLADSTDLSDPKKIAEKHFFRYIGSIQNDPLWFSSIEKTAKENKNVVKKELMSKALYDLSENKMFPSEMQSYFKKKYSL